MTRLLKLHADTLAAAARMDAMRPRFETYRERHTNGTAPRAVAAYQLFQTPAALAARMAELADIGPGRSVLEPSAGLGRLLRPILDRSPRHVTACEIAADCCAELYREFPGVTLLQRDFLTVPHPREGDLYDRVVMNPPFHMRADIRHTLHALGFLRSGGVLVGLCLSTPHREKALRHLCDLWETIPAGTFRESGTGVETILFRITNP